MFVLTGQRILSCWKIYMGSQIIIRRLFVSLKSEQREELDEFCGIRGDIGWTACLCLTVKKKKTTLSLDRAGDIMTNVCSLAPLFGSPYRPPPSDSQILASAVKAID